MKSTQYNKIQYDTNFVYFLNFSSSEGLHMHHSYLIVPIQFLRDLMRVCLKPAYRTPNQENMALWFMLQGISTAYFGYVDSRTCYDIWNIRLGKSGV